MLREVHGLTPALRAAALAVAVLPWTAACGGGGASAPAEAAAPSPAPTPFVSLPAAPLACGATQGLALPDGWPAGVPLPAGLVVTRTERRSGDRLIATTRVPGDWRELVRFFDAALPAAGYTQRNGQVDPFDAESDFVGPQVQGRWAVGLSPECEGAASLTVLVLPAAGALPPPSPVASP